jgi:hypothetical protein
MSAMSTIAGLASSFQDRADYLLHWSDSEGILLALSIDSNNPGRPAGLVW